MGPHVYGSLCSACFCTQHKGVPPRPALLLSSLPQGRAALEGAVPGVDTSAIRESSVYRGSHASSDRTSEDQVLDIPDSPYRTPSMHSHSVCCFILSVPCSLVSQSFLSWPSSSSLCPLCLTVGPRMLSLSVPCSPCQPCRSHVCSLGPRSIGLVWAQPLSGVLMTHQDGLIPALLVKRFLLLELMQLLCCYGNVTSK